MVTVRLLSLDLHARPVARPLPQLLRTGIALLVAVPGPLLAVPLPQSPVAVAPSSVLLQDGEPLVLRAPALAPVVAPSPLPIADPAPGAAGPPPSTELVLDRRQRLLRVMAEGRELRRFPVGVGMPGWETPVGRFQVIEMATDPVWRHPAKGTIYPPGPSNPLGSRWIGFHHDCRDRSGFNGQEHLEVKGCATAGFHGTNDRASVGRAASHGCVRLFDEHVRELFQLVRVGTPVTVLP